MDNSLEEEAKRILEDVERFGVLRLTQEDRDILEKIVETVGIRTKEDVEAAQEKYESRMEMVSDRVFSRLEEVGLAGLNEEELNGVEYGLKKKKYSWQDVIAADAKHLGPELDRKGLTEEFDGDIKKSVTKRQIDETLFPKS